MAHASRLVSVTYHGYIKAAGVKSWAPLIISARPSEDLLNSRSHLHIRCWWRTGRIDTQYACCSENNHLTVKDKLNGDTANLPARTSVDFMMANPQSWQVLVRQLKSPCMMSQMERCFFFYSIHDEDIKMNLVHPEVIALISRHKM